MVVEAYRKVGRGFTFPGYEAVFPRRPGYSIRHASIELWVKPEEKELEGLVELEITSGERPREIRLDANEMEIIEVRLDGAEVDYVYTGSELIVRPVRPFTKKVKRLLIRYRVVEPRYGLYFIDMPEMVYTQGETIWTSYWLPIYREPNMKFTFDVTLHVPSEWKAFSNGVLVDVQRRRDEAVWRYSFRFPSPSYLIAFAAGRFHVVKDRYRSIELEYIVPEEFRDLVETTFRNTRDMLKFFEDWLGVQYPYPVYRQVMVRDFVVGGMENISITILNDLYMMDEHSRLDFRIEGLLSHELAHQWFGDLVTCKDWSQIWINEGFATFLNILYDRHWLGMDEYIYTLIRTMDSYLGETKEYTRPTVYRVYKYPEELFDRHVYERGGLILNMLMNLLGEETFRKGLKLFLTRHRFGNVDTNDLKRVLEEVSGEDLDWFFETFLYNAGHPQLQLSIERDESGLKLIVEQVQDESMPEVYKIPVEMMVKYVDGSTEVKTVRLTSRKEVFEVGGRKEVEYVVLDPYFKVFAELKLKYDLDMLSKIVLGDAPIYWRVLAVRALSRMKGKKVVDILEEAVEDKFWGVAREAVEALAKVGSEYAYRKLRSLLERDLHPRVRAAVVSGVAKFRKKEDFELLKSILSNVSEAYSVRAEAAYGIGLLNVEDGVETLKQFLNGRSYAYIVERYVLRGIAEYDSDEAYAVIKEYAEPGKPEALRREAIALLGNYPERKETYRLLNRYAEDPSERIRRSVVRACEKLMNPKAVKILDKILGFEVNGFIAKAALITKRKIEEALEKGVEYKRLREEMVEMEARWRELSERIGRVEALEHIRPV